VQKLKAQPTTRWIKWDRVIKIERKSEGRYSRWEVGHTAAGRGMNKAQMLEDVELLVKKQTQEIKSRRVKEDEWSGSLKVLFDERLDHRWTSLKKRSVGPEEVEEAGVGFTNRVQ
jgi:hypothetical protein